MFGRDGHFALPIKQSRYPQDAEEMGDWLRTETRAVQR